MTEAPAVDPIQETSELTFMKSKFPLLKQKLAQPFPYFYALAPKDQSLYNEKLAEIKIKIKENPQLPEHKDIFQALALGKIQGMPATSTPLDVLSKYFQFENKEFWTQFTKQKVGQKFYGLPKQKTHSLWEVKDLELLKEVFNIQQAKKQRKIVKQYSNFYKAGCKFSQKFEKIKNQNDVLEAYEQYKKVEQEDSKMNKILTSQKNKSTKVVAQIPVQPAEKPEKVQENNNEQKNVEVIQQQIIKPNCSVNEVNKNQQQKVSQEKTTKKKTQAKEQPSNKKQNKAANDKQQPKLDFFFKKKPKEPQQTQKESQMQEELTVDKTDVFISSLGFNKQVCESTEDLKEQFKNFKKKMEAEVKICYVSINMLRSRLELQNFPVKEVKADFLDPFTEHQNIRYDDSSDEYSELVADSINQEMVQEEEEEQEEESNSAIVSDSFCEYKSSHVMSSSESSDEQQEIKVKPQITKSIGKWFFSAKEVEKRQKYAKYDIICLEDAFPIMVKDQTQQNNNEITSTQKIEMYKQIHGSYTPKQILTKKLNTIVQNKISMNKLSTLIKDICEKKGTQRVLKTEIIKQIAEELAELYPNLEAELEQIRNERETARNIETEAKRQEKMNERDQKIQKLILQFEGQVSTSLLLQYLRNKEVKILKQQLNSIIKTKQGEKWEQIRNEIKKKKLIKKGRTKKEKPSKNEGEQNLMNSHRPIDEILRQNQIDNMNKPKKEKKVIQQGEMVDQAAMQVEEEQEQYIDPQDDESFELNNKRKKKKEKSKNKKIVKISPLLPPVRRNPRRNKKKSKKYNQQQQNEEKVNQEKDEQMEQESQNEENKDPSKSEQKSDKQECENKSAEMMAEEENKQAENQKVNPQEKSQKLQKGSSEEQVLISLVQEKNASPIRNIELPQKKDGEEIEKTANKVGPSEPGVESG